MRAGIRPGRNTLLENVWRLVSGVSRSLFGGQQLPVNSRRSGVISTARERNYDLEIREVPIRDAQMARELIELVQWCPEAATAIDILVGDCFSSEDGDDQGFTIAATLNDNVTPVDPQVRDVAIGIIDRLIGGNTLKVAVERFLSYGDAFCNLAINTRTMRIDDLIFLPTWEVFKIQDEHGRVSHYEQRQRLLDSDPLEMHPLTVVQWSYRPHYMYGRGLFLESTPDWAKLKEATEALAIAALTIGYNPNVHIMPAGADPGYQQAYRDDYEMRLADGIVTDFYMMNGGEVKKLGNNPDLKALSENVLQWRSRIIMRSRVPPWLLNMPTQGARDIAGQPALAYARFINAIRMTVTSGIRQIIDTELSLHYAAGRISMPAEGWKYRVVWPKIYTNTLPQSAAEIPDEANAEGIEDTEIEVKAPNVLPAEAGWRLNGNGRY